MHHAIQTNKGNNSVFVVHGHDDNVLNEFAYFLNHEFKLTPIILRDNPGRGNTLIEKFEELASKVSYAFALLTPDDLIHKEGSEYYQSRPNVIFEMGWLYGKLTRK